MAAGGRCSGSPALQQDPFFYGKTPSAFAAGAPSKGGYLLTNVNGKLSFLSLIIFRAGQQLANGISGTQANKGGGRRAAGRKTAL